jgi:putative ABC transport system ATP-binding protein
MNVVQEPQTLSFTSVQFALEARNLTKIYNIGERQIHALKNVNFSVKRGESVAIVGPSGGGKSTLLGLLGGLDTPTSGQVFVAGRDLSSLSELEQVKLRRGSLGYIFQGYDLLPALSVLENVEYPLLVAGIDKNSRRELARVMLSEVGLHRQEDFLPDELSGGQQQRVGIARCLVAQPSVVLADEPTGNLDSSTSHSILELLITATIKRNMSLVMVTHDLQVAARADRTVQIRDGKLEVHS